MECNKTNAEARELTYAEFPSKFVWKQDKRIWIRRSRGKPIGRIHHVSPKQGDLFYLRILLNKVRGPTSYDDIKTVNGKIYETHKEACYALGLLDDDQEYINCITEAAESGSGNFLRSLFVMLLLSDSLTRPNDVWDQTWQHLSEDILNREQLIHRNPGNFFFYIFPLLFLRFLSFCFELFFT